MRILVLGATGQLGTRVVRQLLQDFPDAEVVGTGRSGSPGIPPRANSRHLAFDPFQDDWLILGQVEVLINCIGIIRETPGNSFEQIHQRLPEQVLRHRAGLGSPKIIHLSALGASSESSSRFLRTKGIADDLVLRHPRTVVLRPSIVCTPNTTLVQKLNLVGRLCFFTGGLLPFPRHMLGTQLQPVARADLAELVSSLCRTEKHPPLLEVVGADRFTVGQLLGMVPACRRILPVPALLFRLGVPLLRRLLPQLLDQEQLLLLEQDNIGNPMAAEQLLGRPMASTVGFWLQQLRQGQRQRQY